MLQSALKMFDIVDIVLKQSELHLLFLSLPTLFQIKWLLNVVCLSLYTNLISNSWWKAIHIFCAYARIGFHCPVSHLKLMRTLHSSDISPHNCSNKRNRQNNRQNYKLFSHQQFCFSYILSQFPNSNNVTPFLMNL